MNANQIAFGIELETPLPGSDATPIGPYHGGYQVAWLPEGWKAERDGSIVGLSDPALAGAAQSIVDGVPVQSMQLRERGNGQAVVDEPLPGLYGSA